MWETLERDMAPHAVIQRGFGGSRMADLLYYADRYIKPHTFQAMVLFVANDITGSEEHDITPRQVAAQFEEFILKMKGYQPDLNLFISGNTNKRPLDRLARESGRKQLDSQAC